MFLRNFCKESSTFNQYLSAIVVNIISLAHGCALAWTSPALPYLKSSDTHLPYPVTASEASWIGSAVSIGAFVTTLIYGKVSDAIGKKKSFLILIIPNLIFWTLVYFSKSVEYLYVARFCSGLTGGGLIRILAVYIAEISERNVRGTLGTYGPLAMYGGMFLMFVLGTYIDFFTLPLVLIPLPIIAFVAILFLPDTPQYFIKNGDFESALESLMFYRNCSDWNDAKMEKIKVEMETLRTAILNVQKEKVKFKDFTSRKVRLGLAMSLFLIIIMVFSGNIALITYTADIFISSGSALSPNESSMIVGFVQLIGVYVSCICVDRFGRKILMSISCGGSALFFFILASYMYINNHIMDISFLNWIPIVSLSVTVFQNANGIRSLPLLMITELLPLKIRDESVTFILVLFTGLGFVNLKAFIPIVELIEFSGAFWFYSSVCLIGTFISIFILPETKGKNLYEA